MEFLLLLIPLWVIQAFVFGFFCGYIAQEKGRSYGSWFALGFFFSILAVFALIAVPKVESASRKVGDGGARPPTAPDRPASIPAPAAQQLFDGQRDIALPAYQLFLTKRFGVEKNNTLDKFVIGNDVFNDLPAALADADARYGQQLAELAAQKLQVEREASAREQSEIEAAQREQAQAEQRRAQQELRRVEAAALAKQHEENRQKAMRKAIPWAMGAAVVVCVVGGMLFRQHSIQEEAARLAWQPTGKVIKDCADCPEMLAMPAGSFDMGSGADGPATTELPLHQVKLPGFLLGRTEVTQGQWRAVIGNNPSRFKDCGDDCPVENISWDDAQQFATKLSQKTGKIYRLPTEAEWEYAARAGGKGRWSFGDDESQLGAHAWFSANSDGKTHPVGQKKASVIGLHDIHGNVWEWVQDVWHENYQGAPSDGSAWVNGGDQARRVLRGGAWNNNPRNLRSANRSLYAPVSFVSTGMRIARTL
jgi:formylglycine-generating enzyme required for sulfatase activity